MQRLLAKIGNFSWSWGFLEFLLAIIVLLALAYVEEDWRGSSDWAATKARWEAHGESFDYKKFIPPFVSDDQNIAALPLFKLEKVPIGSGMTYLREVTFHHATRDDLPDLQYVHLTTGNQGGFLDMKDVRKVMAANYALAVKDAKPPDDLLAQFNAIYPFFTDFFSDAATRPYFRINSDYSTSPPAARSLGPLTDSILLAKILWLHAFLAIQQHQPDLALQDIKTNLTVAAGTGRDPSIVGGLVALGVAAIGNGAVSDGLAQHAWNDAQLAELDKSLKPVDYLAGYQFSMRAETAQGIENLEFFQRSSRSNLEKIFGRSVYESPVISMIGIPWPSGWWDDNKSRVTDTDLHLVATVDPKTHVCFPKLADQLKDQAHQEELRWDRFAPWKMFAVMMSGSITGATEKFAEGQVKIDQMRIACALERFHLAHNAYPDSLDALAPAYLDAVPHDPMSGKAYRYSLRADGTFLLYSVGWNQTDDGGTIAFAKDNPKVIDYDNGDWVWPTPRLPR